MHAWRGQFVSTLFSHVLTFINCVCVLAHLRLKFVTVTQSHTTSSRAITDLCSAINPSPISECPLPTNDVERIGCLSFLLFISLSIFIQWSGTLKSFLLLQCTYVRKNNYSHQDQVLPKCTNSEVIGRFITIFS